MPKKLSRSQWGRQPVGPVGINWEHARAEGLAFFAPLSGAHGTRDLVQEQLGVRTGLEEYLPTQTGEIYHRFFASNRADFPVLPLGIGLATPFTVAWTQEPRSESGYSALLVVNFGVGGTDPQFTVYQAASDAAYGFVVGPLGTVSGGSNAARFTSIGPTVNDQLDRFVVQCLAGPTSQLPADYVLWRNGVKYTTAAVAAMSAFRAAVFRVGALSDNSDPFEGLVGDMRMWSRVLSDGEAEEESTIQGSWALYQPQRILVPGSVAGGSFSATGALAADAATISGAASHLTLHQSSGALSAGSATLAGAATHLTLHTATGALSAEAATVAGSASLSSAGAFSATGSLSSDAATLSGTAVHYTLHTATGAIAADAATVAGSATHLTLHTATGELTAGSATVAGVAVHSGPGAVEDTRPQGAGRPRRQIRRVVVEIDGEDFIVNSEEEAVALLDKAKAEAEEVAKVQIQRAAKAAERKPRKVITDARKTLVLPEIKAPGLEEYVSQVLSEIQDSYSSAMRTIEVSALLRKRDRDEEDDEEVLMLML